MVAPRRRTDQSRHGDPVACGRHRGQYRSRQHGRGRRHPDRAGGTHPDRRPHPRHRRARPRSCGGGDRAESRGQAIGRCTVDGTAARREPQPGRCGIVGAHHARRLCHGVDRRHHQAACHRRRLQARGGSGRKSGSAGIASRAFDGAADQSAAVDGLQPGAWRSARRPRLARQLEPHRPRRTEPQRDRLEEWRACRRRPAARQQMEFREHQSQPAPAERRRRGAQPRRGGRASLVGARHRRPARKRRAQRRPPRQQCSDQQHLVGAAPEGRDLHHRCSADRRIEGRTRARRRADLSARQDQRRRRPHHRYRYARLSDGDRTRRR